MCKSYKDYCQQAADRVTGDDIHARDYKNRYLTAKKINRRQMIDRIV